MAWTSPKTWTADELLTASDLNQYISDNLSALYALVQGGGRKNLLHNGAMRVCQRGTSVASITSSGYKTADRWNMYASSIGTWTQSVEADAPTGSGFRNSLKMLCTTADASPSASDALQVNQTIEGQNVQSVLKGTTSAQQLTLSFWVKSNKTGTYVIGLQDATNSRHVSATYTVSASATWEQKTVTFPADLTGAITNDATGCFSVVFWLAAGTDWTSGTLATTWATGTAANRAVGQTNLAASTNNYWQVAGVQLEVGAAATGFEHKDYGQELAECQRYYQKFWADSAVSGSALYLGIGAITSTTAALIQVPLACRMRIAPAFSYAGTIGVYTYIAGGAAITSGSTYGAPQGNTATLTLANTGATWNTANAPAMVHIPASTGGTYIDFSADL